jgi:hypothetical protein
VVNAHIDGVLGKNGETTLNKNGQKLMEFASWNALKITNSLFHHKEIHKVTWSAHGSRSIIDYILVNKKAPSLVKDTRVYRGFDVSTNHFLLIFKISLPQKWYKPCQRPKQVEEVFRVNLLEEPSIRYIYQSRIEQYLSHSSISLNINIEWETLKSIKIIHGRPGEEEKEKA